MKIDLAYGKSGLIVELPDDQTTVIEPDFLPGLPDELELELPYEIQWENLLFANP